MILEDVIQYLCLAELQAKVADCVAVFHFRRLKERLLTLDAAVQNYWAGLLDDIPYK